MVDYNRIIQLADNLASRSKNPTWAKISAKVREFPTAKEAKPFWRAHYLIDEVWTKTRPGPMKEDIRLLSLMVDDAGARFMVGHKFDYIVHYFTPTSRFDMLDVDQRYKFFSTKKEAVEFAKTHSSTKYDGQILPSWVGKTKYLSIYSDNVRYILAGMNPCIEEEIFARYQNGKLIPKS